MALMDFFIRRRWLISGNWASGSHDWLASFIQARCHLAHVGIVPILGIMLQGTETIPTSGLN
jgi:hypothetical protein